MAVENGTDMSGTAFLFLRIFSRVGEEEEGLKEDKARNQRRKIIKKIHRTFRWFVGTGFALVKANDYWGGGGGGKVGSLFDGGGRGWARKKGGRGGGWGVFCFWSSLSVGVVGPSVWVFCPTWVGLYQKEAEEGNRVREGKRGFAGVNLVSATRAEALVVREIGWCVLKAHSVAVKERLNPEGKMGGTALRRWRVDYVIYLSPRTLQAWLDARPNYGTGPGD